jgi:Flp pilus assembly protein CpaB
MRPRTFILLILVLLVGAVAAVLLIANSSGDGPLSFLSGGDTTETGTEAASEGSAAEEPNIPVPTATPSVFLETVIIAKTNIPVGEPIRSDLVEVEERPNTNIALQGGYTFSEENLDDIVGQIAKVNIVKGQALLRPMLALNPTDLASMGSDLALYIDQGNVAVAVPIDNFSGAAYALRPGDRVDVLMTLSLIDLDEEFNTPLPNNSARVDLDALTAGASFLMNDGLQGRLEWIPELNLTAEIKPRTSPGPNDEEPGKQIPRRATQLTIQQAEVLWMGTWRLATEEEATELVEQPVAAGGEEAGTEEAETEETETGVAPEASPTPVPGRFEKRPDLAILSMPAQDALLLKWAMEVGINIDLALRAQGDTTVFTTTSVTLPQIVEQGGLTIPETGVVGLEPPVNEVEPPSVPPKPPED